MIVLTAYGLAWATALLGMEERWEATSSVNVELEQTAEKVISEHVWGEGVSLKQSWVIFRDFIFSLMCTGRLQVEGQFEKGEVGKTLTLLKEAVRADLHHDLSGSSLTKCLLWGLSHAPGMRGFPHLVLTGPREYWFQGDLGVSRRCSIWETLLIITAVFARLLSPDSAERAGKDHQEVWLKESKIPSRDPDSEIQGWDLQSILKFFFFSWWL